jgi:hypothetical protein
MSSWNGKERRDNQGMEVVATLGAQKALKDFCSMLGVDTTDQDSLNELRADLVYARKQRKGSEEVIKWVKRSCVLAVVSGLVVLLGRGAEEAIKALLSLK